METVACCMDRTSASLAAHEIFFGHTLHTNGVWRPIRHLPKHVLRVFDVLLFDLADRFLRSYLFEVAHVVRKSVRVEPATSAASM